MHLTLRILGLELFDLDWTTDSPSPEPDAAVHLSGGTTVSTPVGYAQPLLEETVERQR